MLNYCPKLAGKLNCMTLIKSISGIRGTIGGVPGENLTPLDAVKFAAAFGTIIKQNSSNSKPSIVIGRDARISGSMISSLVSNTLLGLGIDVIDLGLSTTPTVEMAVPMQGADAGIILTASHNPAQWNALKLLNHEGEFISGELGAEVLKLAEEASFSFAEVHELGIHKVLSSFGEQHIAEIINLPLVDRDAIASRKFKVVVDGINSSGAIYVPMLLQVLGVEYTVINEEPNGHFAHNPEPLPAHLVELSEKVVSSNADLGIVVDPDVDRLAFVMEDGKMFGEEYTLVAVADYILSHKKGAAVSNMSSSRALADVAHKHGCEYFSSEVGEVNVVRAMKAQNAVIGGEGNGGIIYPELHYGRDALVGIALFLTHLAREGMSCSALRNTYPNYVISKNKIDLDPKMDVDGILAKMKEKYANEDVDTRDGVKISFDQEWVQLRKSNTEPIIRVYAESRSEADANKLAEKIMSEIQSLAHT